MIDQFQGMPKAKFFAQNWQGTWLSRLLSFLFAPAAIIYSVAAQPALAETGLLLKQTSARYGAVTCMATHKHFRMDASELHVFLKPPFKTVDLYNMASKTTLSCSVDEISKETNWHELTKAEAKAKAKEVTEPTGEDMMQQYKLHRFHIVHVAPNMKNPALDFWTTTEKDFPQELAEACCKLTGLPPGYGFPVRMYQYRRRYSRSGKEYPLHYQVLDTTKITIQDFPATTFAQPQGFRKVPDLMELMISDPE